MQMFQDGVAAVGTRLVGEGGATGRVAAGGGEVGLLARAHLAVTIIQLGEARFLFPAQVPVLATSRGCRALDSPDRADFHIVSLSRASQASQGPGETSAACHRQPGTRIGGVEKTRRAPGGPGARQPRAEGELALD